MAGADMALADFWNREPDTVWEPPGLTFTVGDRVQIRPSPECQVEPDGGIAENEGIEGHFPEENGLIGEVREITTSGDSLARQGHHFRVRFEGVVMIRGWWCHGGRYAAAELVLIDDEARARQHAAGPADDGEPR